jgi:hypothetical protein
MRRIISNAAAAAVLVLLMGCAPSAEEHMDTVVTPPLREYIACIKAQSGDVAHLPEPADTLAIVAISRCTRERAGVQHAYSDVVCVQLGCDPALVDSMMADLDRNAHGTALNEIVSARHQ